MTLEQALEFMWARKESYQPFKLYGELAHDVEMRVWNGTHPVESNTSTHIAPAGTTVQVLMVSRFGDVGITDVLDDREHGYHARVEPISILNWREAK